MLFRHRDERRGTPMIVESLYGGDGQPSYTLHEIPGARQCRVVGADEEMLSLEGEHNPKLEIELAQTAASKARSAFLALGPWRDQHTSNARQHWQRLRATADTAASHAEQLRKQHAPEPANILPFTTPASNEPEDLRALGV